MLLQPKNWVHFQHYKDRCPPWIKLHRELLNDRDFICLPLASKALAPMLWLLASESKDGTFDGSMDEVTFRLRITENEYHDGVKPLIDKGFFIVASGVLAERLQVAIPETEKETEAKKETKKKATIVAAPDGVSNQTWEDFKTFRKARKAPITQKAIDAIAQQAELAGWSLEQALTECVMRGWTGFKSDWVNKSLIASVNKFDVANVTTPTPKNYDAALRKIEEDAKKAAPMPDSVRDYFKKVKA